MILYSGHEEEDAHHTEGVALMLLQKTQHALISWEAAGPRIIYASLKRSSSTLFIVTHPQSTRTEKQKRSFTTNFRYCVTNWRGRTRQYLRETWTPKLYQATAGTKKSWADRDLATLMKTVDLCAFNNVIIGDSVFLHRRIHKATWVAPKHRTENQIDHICIGRKFKK